MHVILANYDITKLYNNVLTNEIHYEIICRFRTNQFFLNVHLNLNTNGIEQIL